MRITKDHDENIVERTRYHYKDETPGFIVNASKLEAQVNESILFSVSDIFVSTGGSTHISWNMGDGRVFDDNRHSFYLGYSSAGAYTVTATLTTNEYPPVTRPIYININYPLFAYVCADGPIYRDLCEIYPSDFGECTEVNTDDYSPTWFYAHIAPGTGCAGDYTYNWQYKEYSSYYWINLGTSQMIWFPSHLGPGTYIVRCTVTDSCNNSYIAQHWMELYEYEWGCYWLRQQEPEPEPEEDEEQEPSDVQEITEAPKLDGVPSGTVIYLDVQP